MTQTSDLDPKIIKKKRKNKIKRVEKKINAQIFLNREKEKK